MEWFCAGSSGNFLENSLKAPVILSTVNSAKVSYVFLASYSLLFTLFSKLFGALPLHLTCGKRGSF